MRADRDTFYHQDCAVGFERLARRARHLRVAVGGVCEKHAPQHPILRNPEGRGVLLLMLERLEGTMTQMDVWMRADGDPAALRLGRQHHQVLVERYGHLRRA